MYVPVGRSMRLAANAITTLLFVVVVVDVHLDFDNTPQDKRTTGVSRSLPIWVPTPWNVSNLQVDCGASSFTVIFDGGKGCMHILSCPTDARHDTDACHDTGAPLFFLTLPLHFGSLTPLQLETRFGDNITWI